MKTITLNRPPATLITIVLAATLLAGCKGNALDYRNARMENSKVYAENANEPFFGKLTNVPDRHRRSTQRMALIVRARTARALTQPDITEPG